PAALLTVGGFVALQRAPASIAMTAEQTAGQPLQQRVAALLGTTSLRAVLAVWAAAVVVFGAAPMALAQANSTADPIIAESIDGDAAPLNFAAPGFTLTDQHGNQVSLASLRGKVVLLTFLDPVCTTDCPLIAQEFRAADAMLGTSAARVVMVAV